MSRRLLDAALALYPAGFRRRYGDELRDLVGAQPVRPALLLDLVRGAAVAHVRGAGRHTEIAPEDRLRASAAGLFACWIAFAVAGLAFAKSTEDAPFGTAGRLHPLLGGAHAAIQVIALVASLAVVAGALPIALPAIRAARRDPALRRPLVLALGAGLTFAALTALLVLVAHSGPGFTAGRVAFAAWAVAGLVCAAVGVHVTRRIVFAAPVARSRIAAALAGGTVAAAGMAGMTIATALYAIALPVDASALAGTSNGPLSATTTGASLVVLLAVMAVASALAITTARRGWRAVRA